MPSRMDHHDLLSGLVRLHILHHAAQHPVYGQWMIDELGRHGYRLSPGTLYPMLSKMERDGTFPAPPSATGARHENSTPSRISGAKCWFPRRTEPVFPPRSEPPLSMVF